MTPVSIAQDLASLSRNARMPSRSSSFVRFSFQRASSERSSCRLSRSRSSGRSVIGTQAMIVIVASPTDESGGRSPSVRFDDLVERRALGGLAAAGAGSVDQLLGLQPDAVL